MTQPATTRYRGYRSFDYLRPGEDFRRYDLVPQRNRVGEYVVELDDAGRARFDRLLAEHPVISLHDHVTVYPSRPSEIAAYCRDGRVEVGYEGLSRSGLTAVFDNLNGPTGCVTSAHGWKWSDTVHEIGLRLADLAKQDFVVLATTVEDILAAQRDGRVAMVLGLESATMIENELDRLDMLYGFGIRQMGLVYSDANGLGGGLKEHRDGGLTRFGRSAVRRMNQLGMLIDVSHAGDRTSLQACEVSETPVVATHAGARGVWGSERMKPDVVLRAIADSGGVIGIEAAPRSTVSPQHPKQRIESVLDHFEYCVDLLGIDHVTFGPDTIYADHSAFHEAMPMVFRNADPAGPPADDAISRTGVTNPVPDPVSHVEGVEDPTEAMRNLLASLVARGYADEDLQKVAGGNTLRVLRQVWPR
ncbi:membrane dipeptidase [Pseudonocardia kongjuensis]|uniref:Membrane dipeptidase n=1 Tax=Pseudonocardia kongjuensis TaxID=102227 RepID=A0ABP4IDP7_9PSEU